MLVLSGVPKSAAIGFAVLYHLVQVVPVTLAGATVIFRVGFTLDGLRRRGLGGGSVRAAEPDRKQFDSGTDKPPGTGGSFPWDGPFASHEPVLCQKSIEENIHESVALSRLLPSTLHRSRSYSRLSTSIKLWYFPTLSSIHLRHQTTACSPEPRHRSS